MNRKGILFILSSPSGGGKSTLLRMVIEKVGNLCASVSYTTRPKRPGEKDGIDYHFIGKKAFKGKISRGDFVEWAIVHDHFYGTSKHDLGSIVDKGKDAIMDIDIQGARQLKKTFPVAVMVFILPPSLKELEKRLRQRDTEDDLEIDKRLGAAIEEIKSFSDYDYLVINRDLLHSASQMEAIITAERLRPRLLEPGDLFSTLLAEQDELDG